ncbi:MAG: hypothetical protein A3J63_02930 [Candidatus Moranbacteria bacterium RIFCSPHIGHO2_02_FULL_40_12b]|nr:MAG: hypothetical protein A3J63_02930 [Candidatus Moranbacteria bacterium RIFCSPHIGHO2_02_FULL_40_12b]
MSNKNMPKSPEQFRPYTMEEAEEEASKMKEKIKNKQAKNYPEAEKAVEKEYEIAEYLEKSKNKILESVENNEPIISSINFDFGEKPDSSGKFIAVTDIKGRIYTIAMPREIFEYHAETARWAKTFLSDIRVEGGGVLEFDEKNKKIILSGKSGSYGMENRENTYLSLKNNFPDYKIETDDINKKETGDLDTEVENYKKRIIENIESIKAEKIKRNEEIKNKNEFLAKEKQIVIELMKNNPEKIFEIINNFKEQSKGIYEALQEVIESYKNPEKTAFTIGKYNTHGMLGEFGRPENYEGQVSELQRTLFALSDLSRKINLVVNLNNNSENINTINNARFELILENINELSEEKRLGAFSSIFSKEVNEADHEIDDKLEHIRDAMTMRYRGNTESAFIKSYLDLRYGEESLKHALEPEKLKKILAIKNEIKQTLGTIDDMVGEIFHSTFGYNLYVSPDFFATMMPVVERINAAVKLAESGKYKDALSIVRNVEEVPQEIKIKYFNKMVESLVDIHKRIEGNKVTIFYDLGDPSCSGCVFVEKLLQNYKDIGIKVGFVKGGPGYMGYEFIKED